MTHSLGMTMSRWWVQGHRRASISSGDLLGSFQGKHSVCISVHTWFPTWRMLMEYVHSGTASALERLQNYATRVILGRRRDVFATAMPQLELGWPTLALRLKLSEITAVFRCFSGHSPPYLFALFEPSSQVHQHENRSSTSKGLLIPHSCTNHRKKSLAFRGSKSWNALPPRLRDIKNLDIHLQLQLRNIYYLTPYELLHAIPNWPYCLVLVLFLFLCGCLEK